MKSIRDILIIFLFTNLCFSQTGWYQVNSGTNKFLTCISFLNDNTGFITGKSGTILKTTNNGSSWQSVEPADTLIDMFHIYFKNQLTGYILGHSRAYTDSLYSRIYKTTDGGVTWLTDQYRVNNIFLRSIEFLNDNTGYMCGALYFTGGPNKLYRTTNGGANWSEIEFNQFSPLLCMKFTNTNTGYIGVFNSIYKTTNAGQNWTSIFAYPNQSFNVINSIKFSNENTGFACGGNGDYVQNKNRFIIKTTNGGINWVYVINDTLGSLFNSIIAVNENILYACGSVLVGGALSNNGNVLRSTNGGLSWINEVLPTQNDLYTIQYTGTNNNGFSVGNNGTIYKKDNIVSVTQISTEVPSSINLYQNYPNPFNPETTIKFDISKSGFISLKVYDISGKEIQNLFNGVKEAGSYQLKFDGASLNSGVYFYKLMTNGTTITKSMVLVK